MNINVIYLVVVQPHYWTTINTGDNHELQNVIIFGVFCPVNNEVKLEVSFLMTDIAIFVILK